MKKSSKILFDSKVDFKQNLQNDLKQSFRKVQQIKVECLIFKFSFIILFDQFASSLKVLILFN